MRKTNGLVYLTIDGWERAYTYYTTFPTDGGQAGQPQAIRNIPVVRMIIPAVANPGAPLPVALEVDMNGPVAGKQVALGFDRDNDGTYSADSDELATFPGDRQVRILVGVADGALLLQPQVQDWKKDWDASNVFGPRDAASSGAQQGRTGRGPLQQRGRDRRGDLRAVDDEDRDPEDRPVGRRAAGGHPPGLPGEAEARRRPAGAGDEQRQAFGDQGSLLLRRPARPGWRPAGDGPEGEGDVGRDAQTVGGRAAGPDGPEGQGGRHRHVRRNSPTCRPTAP